MGYACLLLFNLMSGRGDIARSKSSLNWKIRSWTWPLGFWVDSRKTTTRRNSRVFNGVLTTDMTIGLQTWSSLTNNRLFKMGLRRQSLPECTWVWCCAGAASAAWMLGTPNAEVLSAHMTIFAAIRLSAHRAGDLLVVVVDDDNDWGYQIDTSCPGIWATGSLMLFGMVLGYRPGFLQSRVWYAIRLFWF